MTKNRKLLLWWLGEEEVAEEGALEGVMEGRIMLSSDRTSIEGCVDGLSTVVGSLMDGDGVIESCSESSLKSKFDGPDEGTREGRSEGRSDSIVGGMVGEFDIDSWDGKVDGSCDEIDGLSVGRADGT